MSNGFYNKKNAFCKTQMLPKCFLQNTDTPADKSAVGQYEFGTLNRLLAKKLCQMMGGDIRESELGKMSNFTV